MPQLKCPECGNRGELRGTEESFEIRGKTPEGHWPIRKCRQCGAGLVVKPLLGFLFFRPRAHVIDTETWGRMQRLWTEQVENACPHCRRGFPTRSARDDHMAAKHGVEEATGG